MSNKKELTRNIIEMLSHKSLTGYEIYNLLLSNYSELNKIVSEKTFYESLYYLLDAGKIIIIGYNKEYDNKSREKNRCKQKQSFKYGGIIFSGVERDFFEVKKMLNSLEIDKPEEIKKNRSTLRGIFLAKWEQWKNNSRSEVIMTKTEDDKQKYEFRGSTFCSYSYKQLLDKTKNNLDNFDSIPEEKLVYYTKDPNNGNIVKLHYTKEDIAKRVEKRSKIYNKHKNAIVWCNEDRPEGVSHEGVSWNNPYIDLDGSMDLYDFLRLQNFPTLGISNKTEEELYSISNKLIFYIQLKEENHFLKNAFSYALSDEPDSLELFEDIVNNNSDLEDIKKKLTKELDVNMQ